MNTKNLIDLSSSEEYESNNSNRDNDSDDEFVEDDELNNNEDASSIIDHLLAASEASFEKRNDQNYILGFLQELLPAADEEDIEDYSSFRRECDDNESEDNNESGDDDKSEDDDESEDEEVLINKTIEFVNKTMNEKILSKMLSKTKKTRYTAVFYFLRLLLDGQEKMEASETVAKRELIPLSLREKLPTKSPFHDEFVSLQLAAYLRTQKFKATPEPV
ncbi:25186_t:CDS:2 [Cetraspora pellucida]|uniref:25186_t:CDS:1 n=1 Tax=Cetraspora pellucida TaxID=1433469 RepID=A0A9N9NK23_9GLOM|nr:25186_t:CDS:2 [Cetraspora pellucida]